ncbi:MAG: ABC transporter ATP-binding protein [Candidatus Rifleibacteriota bacterium]
MNELIVKNLQVLELGPYDIKVKSGEIAAVSGSSGVGKSIFLRAVADLERHNGEVILDGKNYQEFSGPEWRRQVMYLPSESQWWKETVIEHLLKTPDEALLNQYGFETDVLNWSINRLSSGEKQRLAIIRMLLHQPSLLLLDEPTASLDQDNVKRIEKAISSYLEDSKAAAIWISHDPQQIERIASSHFEILAGGKIRQIL